MKQWMILLSTWIVLGIMFGCGGGTADMDEYEDTGEEPKSEASEKLRTDIDNAMDELDEMDDSSSGSTTSRPTNSTTVNRPPRQNMFESNIVNRNAKENETFKELGDIFTIARSIEAEALRIKPGFYKLNVQVVAYVGDTGDLIGTFQYRSVTEYPEACVQALEQAKVQNALILNPWKYTGLPIEEPELREEFKDYVASESHNNTGVTLPLVFLDPHTFNGLVQGSIKTIPTNDCFEVEYLQIN